LVGIVASIVGCVIVLYAFGIVGMAFNLDKSMVDSAKLVLAFIPGDILKAIIAGVITAALLNARPQGVLSRA